MYFNILLAWLFQWRCLLSGEFVEIEKWKEAPGSEPVHTYYQCAHNFSVWDLLGLPKRHKAEHSRPRFISVQSDESLTRDVHWVEWEQEHRDEKDLYFWTWNYSRYLSFSRPIPAHRPYLYQTTTHLWACADNVTVYTCHYAASFCIHACALNHLNYQL